MGRFCFVINKTLIILVVFVPFFCISYETLIPLSTFTDTQHVLIASTAVLYFIIIIWCCSLDDTCGRRYKGLEMQKVLYRDLWRRINFFSFHFPHLFIVLYICSYCHIEKKYEKNLLFIRLCVCLSFYNDEKLVARKRKVLRKKKTTNTQQSKVSVKKRNNARQGS